YREVCRLAASPLVSRLRGLEAHLLDASVTALAASEHLANLTAFVLIGPRELPMSAASAQAVAGSPHLTRLTELHFSHANFNHNGVTALAESSNLANVSWLSLRRCGIHRAGAGVLAASPHLTRLRRLFLGHTPVLPEGAAALAASPPLAGLVWLDLVGNSIPAGRVARPALS